MRTQRAPSATQFIVKRILQRGNEPGLIAEWFEGMKAWAEANSGPDAAALKTWLGIVHARPFYTAAELAKFWPALKLTLGLADRMTEEPSPNRLANELLFYNLPVLQNEEGSSFFNVGGKVQQFFIVEHCHKWRDVRLTQEEFANVLNG